MRTLLYALVENVDTVALIVLARSQQQILVRLREEMLLQVLLVMLLTLKSFNYSVRALMFEL